MRLRWFIASFGFFAFMHSAHALDHSEAADMLCAKKQSCVMAELEAAGANEDQKDEALHQLSRLCDKIELSYAVPDGRERLHALATHCMKALSLQSCDVLQGREEAEKPRHCKVLEEESGATN